MSALRVMGVTAEDAHRERARRPSGRGTFSQRAVHRTAHGNHLSKLEPDDKFSERGSLYARSSPSSRPRDGGYAGGARTREDTLSPQRSEDEGEGGLTTYEYDLYGNLLRVDLPDGRAIEYEVDGAGRRVGRRELDADGFEISFRGWIYRDLLRPIAEVDASGNVVARYVYSDGDGAAQNGVYQLSTRLGANQDTSLPFSGSNVPESIELLDPGTGLVIQRLQLSTNQVGSVQLVTDADTGDVLQRIQYDEFGRVVFDSNSGVQPFGFAGGLYDEVTGLVRFGARDYSADAGRWTGRDAIRFENRQDNIYLYVNSDPNNRRDANGLSPCIKRVFVECTLAFALCYRTKAERKGKPRIPAKDDACGKASEDCADAITNMVLGEEECDDKDPKKKDPPPSPEECPGGGGDGSP